MSDATTVFRSSGRRWMPGRSAVPVGIGIFALAGLLASCDLGGPGDVPPTHFHASLEGAVHAEFEGTGDFAWASRSFNILASSADGDESFSIQIWTDPPSPPHGQVAVKFEPWRLLELGKLDGDPGTGWVLVQHVRGQTGVVSQHYVAESGTIVINRSASADYTSYIRNRGTGWVEGEFTLTAVRYCPGAEADEACPRLADLPESLPAELPRIQVTGSFVLARADSRVYWDCDPVCG